jgi:cytidylate kinase
MVITIDGYAGSGKTSAALRLAEVLGYELLPTGQMYRAAGAALIERGIDLEESPRDAARIREIVNEFQFEMPPGRVILNGIDYSEKSHCEAAGDWASKVGTFAEVREKLKAEQRRLAKGRKIVCEGRDQGTAVFPDAPFKFFFWATPEVRAERRAEQLRAQGKSVDYETILRQIIERDDRDENRALDPLKQATDAVRIDTTYDSADFVLARMIETVFPR